MIYNLSNHCFLMDARDDSSRQRGRILCVGIGGLHLCITSPRAGHTFVWVADKFSARGCVN